ncbi:AAA ATPase [Exiguobacterium sp. S17]|nr:AAA ATPase [Exiguobacterium sp. S17]
MRLPPCRQRGCARLRAPRGRAHLRPRRQGTLRRSGRARNLRHTLGRAGHKHGADHQAGRRPGLTPQPTRRQNKDAAMTCVSPIRPLPEAADNRVPLGHHSSGALHLDLDRLLAGRLLIQGSSGAGKSRTLRRIIEEAFDYTTIAIVDPEGEFENLARHIGATTIRAVELTADGLTAAAARSRHHRLSIHIDLTDLDPDQRIIKAAAFFAGLIGAPRDDWDHTVLVCIDEGHLLAPHVAGSARDAEARRLGVATLTDLCARGRKRGLAPVIATQRLAKLSTSVVSELQNVLVGLNVFDRDIARAADLLGFSAKEADALRTLVPGDFFAMGPALSATPCLAHIDPTITEHIGKTPELRAAASVDATEAARLLDLAGLAEVADHGPAIALKGTRALDAFLLDPAATDAAAIVEALKRISPNASTARDLARHLSLDAERTDRALNLLSAITAVDTMPKGDDRIARLHARLRARLSDVAVVAL